MKNRGGTRKGSKQETGNSEESRDTCFHNKKHDGRDWEQGLAKIARWSRVSFVS